MISFRKPLIFPEDFLLCFKLIQVLKYVEQKGKCLGQSWAIELILCISSSQSVHHYLLYSFKRKNLCRDAWPGRLSHQVESAWRRVRLEYIRSCFCEKFSTADVIDVLWMHPHEFFSLFKYWSKLMWGLRKMHKWVLKFKLVTLCLPLKKIFGFLELAEKLRETSVKTWSPRKRSYI